MLKRDKIDIKTKAMKKDKEGRYLMTKGFFKKRILQLSIYMPLIQEHPNIYNKY